jgi:hypothetical protein
MSTFRTAIILFLIPVLTACSSVTSAPTPSQAEIEKEEQAVYAVFARQSKGLLCF